jgi:hypothetical protein
MKRARSFFIRLLMKQIKPHGAKGRKKTMSSKAVEMNVRGETTADLIDKYEMLTEMMLNRKKLRITCFEGRHFLSECRILSVDIISGVIRLRLLPENG